MERGWVCGRRGGREEDIGSQGRGPVAAVDGAAVPDQRVSGVEVEDLELLVWFLGSGLGGGV